MKMSFKGSEVAKHFLSGNCLLATEMQVARKLECNKDFHSIGPPKKGNDLAKIIFIYIWMWLLLRLKHHWWYPNHLAQHKLHEGNHELIGTSVLFYDIIYTTLIQMPPSKRDFLSGVFMQSNCKGQYGIDNKRHDRVPINHSKIYGTLSRKECFSNSFSTTSTGVDVCICSLTDIFLDKTFFFPQEKDKRTQLLNV